MPAFKSALDRRKYYFAMGGGSGAGAADSSAVVFDWRPVEDGMTPRINASASLARNSPRMKPRTGATFFEQSWCALAHSWSENGVFFPGGDDVVNLAKIHVASSSAGASVGPWTIQQNVGGQTESTWSHVTFTAIGGRSVYAGGRAYVARQTSLLPGNVYGRPAGFTNEAGSYAASAQVRITAQTQADVGKKIKLRLSRHTPYTGASPGSVSTIHAEVEHTITQEGFDSGHGDFVKTTPVTLVVGFSESMSAAVISDDDAAYAVAVKIYDLNVQDGRPVGHTAALNQESPAAIHPAFGLWRGQPVAYLSIYSDRLDDAAWVKTGVTVGDSAVQGPAYADSGRTMRRLTWANGNTLTQNLRTDRTTAGLGVTTFAPALPTALWFHMYVATTASGALPTDSEFSATVTRTNGTTGAPATAFFLKDHPRLRTSDGYYMRARVPLPVGWDGTLADCTITSVGYAGDLDIQRVVIEREQSAVARDAYYYASPMPPRIEGVVNARGTGNGTEIYIGIASQILNTDGGAMHFRARTPYNPDALAGEPFMKFCQTGPTATSQKTIDLGWTEDAGTFSIHHAMYDDATVNDINSQAYYPLGATTWDAMIEHDMVVTWGADQILTGCYLDGVWITPSQQDDVGAVAWSMLGALYVGADRDFDGGLTGWIKMLRIWDSEPQRATIEASIAALDARDTDATTVYQVP
jgi:hypothetical protein